MADETQARTGSLVSWHLVGLRGFLPGDSTLSLSLAVGYEAIPFSALENVVESTLDLYLCIELGHRPASRPGTICPLPSHGMRVASATRDPAGLEEAAGRKRFPTEQRIEVHACNPSSSQD